MPVAKACDIGTMFFQTAKANPQDQDRIDVEIIRNAFVEIDDLAGDDTEDILMNNDWRYIKDKDRFYVLGEDAIRVARMFPNITLRRPMAEGALNKNEPKKAMILNELIESTVGKAPDDKSWLVTCVSSPLVGGTSEEGSFHRDRVEAMFSHVGWNVKIIPEGWAVVWAEKPSVVDKQGNTIPLSGIGMSFGGGRTNCVLSYRGVPVVGMSVNRGGDWIDRMAADATGESVEKVTATKEDKLDFNNLDMDNDILFALNTYYTSLIKYVLKNFSTQFNQQNKDGTEIDVPLDVVVAGGTSTPNGFCSKLEKVIRSTDLPFEVNQVRAASDPRNAVVKGCYAAAVAALKKSQKTKK